MRRPALVLLGLPLVTAAVVSALAFKQSNVTSAAEITVTATNIAQLAMLVQDTAIATITAGGVLQLSFPAQQPNSTYTYNNVFQVQNRTPATINVSVSNVTGELTPGAHLTITDSGTGLVLWQNGAATTNNVSVTSSGTASMNISVRLDSGVATGASQSLAITMKGQ